MGYIYLITNTVNGKRYVGQTIRKNIETRWKAHRKCDSYSCGSYLLRAYKKYGIEKFKFQIICICFDEDCNRFEEEYINKFNTLSPNGYNLDTGGKNSKHHPDTIKLLSELNKGDKNPQFGRVWTQEEVNTIWTPEFKAERVKQTTGNKNPNFGKKSVHRKTVEMYTLENKLMERFESIHEASIKTKINERSISGTCNGSQKTAGGFIWKFL
jgi:group I intron endonuclease